MHEVHMKVRSGTEYARETIHWALKLELSDIVWLVPGYLSQTWGSLV